MPSYYHAVICPQAELEKPQYPPISHMTNKAPQETIAVKLKFDGQYADAKTLDWTPMRPDYKTMFQTIVSEEGIVNKIGLKILHDIQILVDSEVNPNLAALEFKIEVGGNATYPNKISNVWRSNYIPGTPNFGSLNARFKSLGKAIMAEASAPKTKTPEAPPADPRDDFDDLDIDESAIPEGFSQ